LKAVIGNPISHHTEINDIEKSEECKKDNDKLNENLFAETANIKTLFVTFINKPVEVFIFSDGLQIDVKHKQNRNY